MASERTLTHLGITRTLSEWSDETKIPYRIIWKRLKDGWSAKDTLETPVVPVRKYKTMCPIVAYSNAQHSDTIACIKKAGCCKFCDKQNTCGDVCKNDSDRCGMKYLNY